MTSFEIIGSKKLSGHVKISGAKNEALKLIPLSLILQEKVKISNVPRIADIFAQLSIIKDLGAKVKFVGNNLTIDTTYVSSSNIKSDAANKLRASIVYLGPLVARFGEVSCPLPGGCLIGARSIDTHKDAFSQLGAEIKETDCSIKIKLSKLKQNHVRLKEQSVSATENMLLFAAAKTEKITIENCAIEPEIMHLIGLLNKAGAKIQKKDERVFEIIGSDKLKISAAEVIPDRIEAGSYTVAILATGGEGKISPFPASALGSFLEVLKDAGANFKIKGDQIQIFKTEVFKPFTIRTAPYPGFPTDLQSPISLIASRANGVSTIEETMFENRLVYLKELQKMGLKVNFLSSQKAEIYGPATLKSHNIHSLDLRSGMTLLIAALMAQGKTIIAQAENIDRGYEDVVGKLRSLGAQIKRIK
jgi:UDP-N-acetylglucosamine 1-carboxyvinyltransferase